MLESSCHSSRLNTKRTKGRTRALKELSLCSCVPPLTQEAILLEPKPAHTNANESRNEGDRASERNLQKDQNQFPENEGLLKKHARESGALDAEEGKALEEAAQRGHTT